MAFVEIAPAVVVRGADTSVVLRVLPNLLIPVLPFVVPDVVVSSIGTPVPTSLSAFFLVKRPISLRTRD